MHVKTQLTTLIRQSEQKPSNFFRNFDFARTCQRAALDLKNNFKRVLRSTVLQGLPLTTWLLANIFGSLKIISDVLRRDFFQHGHPLHFQQIISASLVTQVLDTIHTPPIGGRLKVFKTVQKVCYHLPGFQKHNKQFINPCAKWLKRASLPKSQPYFLVEWTRS